MKKIYLCEAVKEIRRVQYLAASFIFSFIIVIICPNISHAIHFDYSNGSYTEYQLIDAAPFGSNGSFSIYEHKMQFDLNIGESTLGFCAFYGGINNPSSGAGSGTLSITGPMTINGITKSLDFDIEYSFQKSPIFKPSTFHFANLPDLFFDFGTEGILVGTWLSDTIVCDGTSGCGGGAFPFVSFTLEAPKSIPEPSSLVLLLVGLTGITRLMKHRKRY